MNQQTTAPAERATANKPGRTSAKTRSSNAAAAFADPVSVEGREYMIAQAAYFRAERRGLCSRAGA